MVGYSVPEAIHFFYVQDVAFADGGLGVDSDPDDDIPLGQRLTGK